MNELYINEVWGHVREIFSESLSIDKEELEGIDEIARIWRRNKAWMMPYFDDEGRRFSEIVLDDKDVNLRVVEDSVYSMKNMIADMISKEDYNKIVKKTDKVVDEIIYLTCFILREFDVSEITSNITINSYKYGDKLFTPGVRTSRVFRHAIYTLVDKEDRVMEGCFNLNKRDEIADLFSTILSQVLSKIKNRVCTVVLSINPIDMIFSSVHTTNWRSCHNVFDGEFSTGPFSYLLDGVTMIGYAFESRRDFTGYRHFTCNPVPDVPVKLWRQLVMIDKDRKSALFGKEYPSGLSRMSKELRSIAAWVLSDMTQHPHSWMYKKITENHSVYLGREGNLGRQRWQFTDGPVAAIKLKEVGEDPVVTPGVREMPCMCCGIMRKDGHTTSILCSDCGGNELLCEHCEQEMDEDYRYQVDGRWYCSDCYDDIFVYCEECEDITWRDDAYWIDDCGYCVCSDCYDNSYDSCSRCNESYHVDNGHLTTDNDPICDYCCDNHYIACCECGYVVESDKIIYTSDTESAYCQKCATTKTANCSDCGERFERDSGELTLMENGDILCHECLEINEVDNETIKERSLFR